MNENIDSFFSHLDQDSDENINWTLDLDCYILKVLPIKSSNLIWVIASEEHVFLVDSEKGKIINKFSNMAELIFSAVILPESRDLLIGTSNGVLILSVEGEINTIIFEDGWFEHIAISEDGSILFAAKGKTLYISQQNNNLFELVEKDDSFTSTISDILYSHNAFLVSNYGGIREYSTGDIKKYNLFEWKTSLLSTSWSPDKKYIVAGTQENAIHFWPYPLESGEDFQISGYQSKVTKMIWSKDATQFVVNSFEDVHIWDFSDGPPTGKSPITLRCGFGKIADIQFERNLLVAATEKGFIFYFIPDTTERFVSIQSLDGEITCISISEDQSELYVGTKAGHLYALEIIIDEIHIRTSSDQPE
jgi:WD40 repeat protein